jgi:hypothetical protein
MSNGTKQSWARAKVLAENTRTSSATARSYLSENKGTYEEFLDSIQAGQTTWDGRNPTCKELTKDLKTLKTNNHRPSKGDPTRTVRAGAPKHVVGEVSIEQLFALKDLVNNLGGLQNTQKALDFLVELEAVS